MPNLTIYSEEIKLLREKILVRYCESVGEDFTYFIHNLTGTLRYYELICDKIYEYLNDEKKVERYLTGIEDSSFKISLLKYISLDQNKKKTKTIADLSAVSADILRKLIFYGPSKTEITFRDIFIFSCYLYIGIDRGRLLKNTPKTEANLSDTINSALLAAAQNNANPNKTIDPFKRNEKFNIIMLDEDFKEIKNSTYYLSSGPVLLNRNNLDPGNLTITSKVQAVIYLEEGDWYINNKSELNTTFIQISKATKLESGDILFLGNKRFKFEK